LEAWYYNKIDDGKVLCSLCPHQCTISSGKSGICRVRTNREGSLQADMYGLLSAMQFDPVEKKPLYHFHPGKEILSLGSLGCNFRCACCQNYEISQSGKAGFPRLQQLTVEDILKLALKKPDNLGVAYTYNEPFVWYEFMADIAREIRAAGKKNVIVSNGYVSEKPLTDLLEFTDAFNIDIKAFSEQGYRKFAHATLKPVLSNLQIIVRAGKHLELTLLLVPEINDSDTEFLLMADWIKENLGADIPLHLSRYFPRYKMNMPATSFVKLREFAGIAKKKLSYVYIGNIPEGGYQDTFCPSCGSRIVSRLGYSVRIDSLNDSGNCVNCGQKILKL